MTIFLYVLRISNLRLCICFFGRGNSRSRSSNECSEDKTVSTMNPCNTSERVIDGESDENGVPDTFLSQEKTCTPSDLIQYRNQSLRRLTLSTDTKYRPPLALVLKVIPISIIKQFIVNCVDNDPFQFILQLIKE